MLLKTRALLRRVTLLLIILAGFALTTWATYSLVQARGEREREEQNWSQSAAAVDELQAMASTTIATTTTTTTTTITSPPTTVPETVPKEMTTTTGSTTTTAAPTTTTTTTLPPTTTTTLPVPPAQVATNEVFGWLVIPRLGIPGPELSELPLLEGDDADKQVYALDRGTAHWPGTSLPGGGGNVVIGGHRTTYMRPFYHLETMQIGDHLEVGTPWGTYLYEVYRVELEVPARPGSEEDALKRTYLSTQADRPGETVTIYACTPRGSTSHRILVQGDLIQVNGQTV